MQQVAGLDIPWLAVIGVLAALGAWLFFTGLARFLRGRFVRGPLRATGGALLATMAIAIASIGVNLYTYQRLNYEETVATLKFRELGPRHFEALLRTADGRERAFEVHGDEWQIDARVLKWQGMGAMLGLDPRYRLERFSGRYASAADEQRATRSIYGLNDGEQGVDIWQMSQDYERFLPFIDTIYGSAAYMPMRDGMMYHVVITEDGLVARARPHDAG